jgi:hypothetical protein
MPASSGTDEDATGWFNEESLPVELMQLSVILPLQSLESTVVSLDDDSVAEGESVGLGGKKICLVDKQALDGREEERC